MTDMRPPFDIWGYVSISFSALFRTQDQLLR